MAIKEWHWGQLIVLWAGALFAEGFAAGTNQDGPWRVVQAAMVYALPRDALHHLGMVRREAPVAIELSRST